MGPITLHSRHPVERFVHRFHATFLRRTTTWTLAIVYLLLSSSGNQSHAALVGFLALPEVIDDTSFETDLFFQASTKLIGAEIELINLDIRRSRVNGSPLVDFSIVQFMAAAPFQPWQDGQQFGSKLGFESQLALDAFAGTGAVPFPVNSTDPFLVGTFQFDYSSLGLSPGDAIVLDAVGVDDGMGNLTTAVAIRESGSIISTVVDPDFSTPAGPGSRTLTVTAVPEPGYFGLAIISLSVLFRRVKRFQS